MALINCPECNKQVSDSAKMCPHCGYNLLDYKQANAKQSSQPIPQPKKKKNGCLVVVGAIVFISILGAIFGDDDSSEKEAIVSNTEQIDTSELTKNSVSLGKWKIKNSLVKEMKYTIGFYQKEGKYFALLDFGNELKKEVLREEGGIFFIVGNDFAEWYKINGDKLIMGDRDGVIENGYVATHVK